MTGSVSFTLEMNAETSNYEGNGPDTVCIEFGEEQARDLYKEMIVLAALTSNRAVSIRMPDEVACAYSLDNGSAQDGVDVPRIEFRANQLRVLAWERNATTRFASERLRADELLAAMMKAGMRLPADPDNTTGWEQVVMTQGWDEGAQITHLMGFIESEGLRGSLMMYAAEMAEQEIGYQDHDAPGLG